MGTADKLFSVIMAMKDQMESMNIHHSDASFILFEIGFAYTAAIAVENGIIIDGIGGTSGNMGYLGMGSMDGELSYAISNSIDNFSKTLLFSGGAAFLAGIDPFNSNIEDFINKSKINKKIMSAYEAFKEAIIKNVFTLLSSMKESPKEILLSGRFIDIVDFKNDIILKLNKKTQPFKILNIRSVNKQSSTG